MPLVLLLAILLLYLVALLGLILSYMLIFAPLLGVILGKGTTGYVRVMVMVLQLPFVVIRCTPAYVLYLSLSLIYLWYIIGIIHIYHGHHCLVVSY
jgi:hypothetical protein